MLLSASTRTKEKVFFKNLRLRRKLHNDEKLETTEAIDEKAEHCSRFRRFINFFKFGRSKISLFMSQRKKSRKISPMKTKLSIVHIEKPCNSSEIVEVFSTVHIPVENTFKKKIEETNLEVCEKTYESSQDTNKKDSSEIISNGKRDLFDRIDVKIAESNKKSKLTPIQGAKLKNIQLESEIYHNQFYKVNFESLEDDVESLPSTAKLPKKRIASVPKRLSEEALKLKQIRANELRAQATEKRIRPITERRERFEKNKAIIDEAKQQSIKNSRDARKKRKEQVALNKTRIDGQKIEVVSLR